MLQQQLDGSPEAEHGIVPTRPALSRQSHGRLAAQRPGTKAGLAMVLPANLFPTRVGRLLLLCSVAHDELAGQAQPSQQPGRPPRPWAVTHAVAGAGRCAKRQAGSPPGPAAGPRCAQMGERMQAPDALRHGLPTITGQPRRLATHRRRALVRFQPARPTRT